MTGKSNLGKPTLGCSDVSTVKLDFDDVPFRVAKFWAGRACHWFRLGGYVILRSSMNHYHVVFDRDVDWIENMRIMCWVASESKIQALKDYVLMQGIKESSTLRVVPKGDKPSPRLVRRFGSQSGRVKVFLDERREIKRIWERVA